MIRVKVESRLMQWVSAIFCLLIHEDHKNLLVFPERSMCLLITQVVSDVVWVNSELFIHERRNNCSPVANDRLPPWSGSVAMGRNKSVCAHVGGHPIVLVALVV